MIIVGVCGNTGSGKSTVCSLLREKGFRIIDCDRVYAALIAPPSGLLDAIKASFSEGVIQPDGTLDRKTLSEIVFSDKKQLEKLNSITFSYIKKRVRKILNLYRNTNVRYAVIDAPLLFESGLNEVCDVTVAVTCPEDVRIKRLTARDRADPAALKKRVLMQTDERITAKKCDFVIENFSDLDSLMENTLLLIEMLERGGRDETSQASD